ncbi:MAG TPA: ROK family transcriptional regulator [Micromonosporaceae bacterium]|nr:ROK family transcriptional regulator [Micromonosporaceae bacterium]
MRLTRGTGPARQATIREHNLSMVLDEVLRADEPISRAGLAAATGLTRATVSALVDELVASGLVAESGRSQSGTAGRPSIGLVASPHGPVGIGLEVNVDYLAVAAVDLAGQLCYEAVVTADQRGVPPKEALGHAEGLVVDAVTALAAADRTATRVALAVPGLVEDHLVRVAPNLDWHDVPIPDTIVGLPLIVDNDANLAAQGELAAALNRERGSPVSRSFLYVSGEIGIGAGVVLDGVLMRGAMGFAGEVGHVAVHPDGPRCGCGAYGCLEQYAGQDAIVRAALMPVTGQTRGTIADVVELARAGEANVIGTLQDAGAALGVVLAGAVNVLDITTIVLGGVVFAPLAPWLAPAVQRELDARVLAARWSAPHIRASALGERSTVRGAAEMALDAVRHFPARFIGAR